MVVRPHRPMRNGIIYTVLGALVLYTREQTSPADRDLEHAPEMARAQGVRSLDMRAAGIVDRIVVEKPDAADEAEEFCARLGDVLRYELAELGQRDRSTLVEQRTRRYQAIGHVGA